MAYAIAITSSGRLGLVLGIDPATLCVVVVETKLDGTLHSAHPSRVAVGDVLRSVNGSELPTFVWGPDRVGISLDELREVFRLVNVPVTPIEAKIIFEAYDTDASGAIQRQVFFTIARDRILSLVRGRLLAQRPLNVSFTPAGVPYVPQAPAAAAVTLSAADDGTADTFENLELLAARLGPRAAQMFEANAGALSAMFTRATATVDGQLQAERRVARRRLSKARRRSSGAATVASATAATEAVALHERGAPAPRRKSSAAVRRASRISAKAAAKQPQRERRVSIIGDV